MLLNKESMKLWGEEAAAEHDSFHAVRPGELPQPAKDKATTEPGSLTDVWIVVGNEATLKRRMAARLVPIGCLLHTDTLMIKSRKQINMEHRSPLHTPISGMAAAPVLLREAQVSPSAQ